MRHGSNGRVTARFMAAQSVTMAEKKHNEPLAIEATEVGASLRVLFSIGSIVSMQELREVLMNIASIAV